MEQHPKDKSVQKLFEKKGGQEEVNRIIEKVRNTSILEDCYKVAEDFSTKARRDIEHLPDKDCRHAMNELADFVVERRK
jgi:geranylgeranyl pyrophosphate synthase